MTSLVAEVAPGAIVPAALVILLGIALVLGRAFAGPTAYDRILAVNMMGTKTVLLLAILGRAGGREGYLDIAILYALINYVATVAILKLVELKRLS